MNSKFLSRGPSVDTEVCVNRVGNKFDLVLIASARAKEISRQNKESDKFEHTHPVVTALLEVESGKIGREYLNKVKKERK